MQKILNLKEFLNKYHAEESEELWDFLNQLIINKPGRWLAGGALRRSIKDGKADSDWDVFFQSEKDYAAFQKECEAFDIKDIKENPNNKQFTITFDHREYVVQCITIAYYQTPEEVISTFDFTICQFVTDGTALWAGDTSLYDLGRMRLAVNKISFPVASLRRLIKYTKQGFYACNGCLNELLSSVATNPQLLNEKFKYID